MKKSYCLFLLVCTLSFSACHNKANNTDTDKKLPKPGTVIAAEEMPVTEDKLNKFTFGIKIIADSDIANGVYDVTANYEYHTDGGQFSMPKGAEDIKPIIRKGSTPYTYIIGFKVAGDTTFYDYYQVKATNTDMKMGYIKAYISGSSSK